MRRSPFVRCSTPATSRKPRIGRTGSCEQSPVVPPKCKTWPELAGERQLPELEIGWLPGYEASRPVRIGNAASEQLQLDIYGEIIGVLYHARSQHLRLDEPAHDLQEALLAHLEAIWREPDEGMWEVRGPRQQFTHSKAVMAWVAFDRAIKNAEEFGFDGPVDRWRAIRQQIHHEVCREAFKPGAEQLRAGFTGPSVSMRVS